MKAKGSILIILDGEGIKVKNFIYMLSKYEGIQEYELIVAYDKQEVNYFQNIMELYFHDICKIKIYECEDIHYHSKVYNEMEQLATTDILVFLNTNIVLGKGSLDELVCALEIDRVMAVQPMLVKFHSMLVQSTGYVHCNRSAEHAFLNRNIHETIVNESSPRSALVSYAMAINRYVFEEFNGFDDTLMNKDIGHELTFKITLAGYVNLYNHKAKVYYMPEENIRLWDLKNMRTRRLPFSREIKLDDKEIIEIFKRQITENQLKKKYVVINFSGSTELKNVLHNMSFKIKKVINYGKQAETGNIEFEKVLPFDMMNEDTEYIYLTNNFIQIKNNPVWFQRRHKYEDLIIDLSGNILKITEMNK